MCHCERLKALKQALKILYDFDSEYDWELGKANIEYRIRNVECRM